MQQRGHMTGESSVFQVSLSTDPKEQCRFILLGGDETAKNDACNFILRTAHTQLFQRMNVKSCEMKENYVQGRHVCVVKSPSYWSEYLKSFWFISSGVKTIQKEMDHSISLVFPGPHAFLLVLRAERDTQEERHLLEAIKSAFGREALNYCIVLFVKRSWDTTNTSVSNCKSRYHFLENTDQSVQELFRKVEAMISKNKSKFFIPSAYERFMVINFESWEKERMQRIQQEAERATETDLIQWH